MKIPPKKPQFFKPIQAGFKKELKIPVSFLKYLKGNEHVKSAILKRGGKKWSVKVNGHRFGEGWENFVKENDLELGGVLVFRHEGGMEFEVLVFDSSHCDREYVEYLQEEEGGTGGKILNKFEFKAKTTENPKLNIKSSHEVIPKVEAEENTAFGSRFFYTITPYCLSRDHVQLPIPFVRENGLRDRNCAITIRDEQMSWTFALYSSGTHTYVRGTWREFCTANRLNEGDSIMLEIVANGKIPVLRFYDLRENASLQPNPDAERGSFNSIIKPHTIERALFYLPTSFARSNKLMRHCEMILRDEKQRSWSVELRPVGPRFAIATGWREFMEANVVKVGDTYKFELINNGTIPEAYLRRKYSRKDAKQRP